MISNIWKIDVCRACKEINPEHPELVAQNIKEMYDALVFVYNQIQAWEGFCPELAVYTEFAEVNIGSILSKIKGGE